MTGDLKAKKAKYQSDNKEKVRAWQAKYRAKVKRELEEARAAMSFKKCTKCHEVKNLKEFNKSKTNRDKRRERCRACTIAMSEKYYEKSKKKNAKAAKQRAEFRKEDRTKQVKSSRAKQSKEEIDRAKKIMSVPVNPRYTQEYYIMQRFTPRAVSNLGDANQEIKLR